MAGTHIMAMALVAAMTAPALPVQQELAWSKLTERLERAALAGSGQELRAIRDRSAAIHHRSGRRSGAGGRTAIPAAATRRERRQAWYSAAHAARRGARHSASSGRACARRRIRHRERSERHARYGRPGYRPDATATPCDVRRQWGIAGHVGWRGWRFTVSLDLPVEPEGPVGSSSAAVNGS